MTARLTIFVVAMSVGVAAASAQHAAHEPAGVTASAASNPACAQGGMKALAIVEAASTRLETARRADNAADLQNTMSQLQTAVAAAQAELFTCRAAVPAAPVAAMPAGGMAGMDNSEMGMGASAARAPATPGGKPADPMAGMDHSKMNMDKPSTAAKPRAPGAKPAGAMGGMDHSRMDMGKPAPGARPAAPGAKAANPMAGMDHSKMSMGKPAAGARPAAPGARPADAVAGTDHSKMPMGGATPKPGDAAMAVGGEAKLPVMMAERIADPACPDNVGQATAPKAVHERKVYYFCSTKARDEFRKDPAAYLKKHPR